jgi:hypothetical protein
MTGEIHKARKYFAEMGFDTIPLKKGAKATFRNNWQTTSLYKLWRHACGDSNIGIHSGGDASVAFIDCDHEYTFTKTQHFMAGLGYKPASFDSQY